ncbi:putative sulfate exporter family transporter [Allokutzneria multivorans]|uniref:Sulfate exporter family transporter n=1 Tax=Allokutzneria multivorans TaxID=1142134 RepID=A0ABP7TMD4_9PSEU
MPVAVRTHTPGLIAISLAVVLALAVNRLLPAVSPLTGAVVLGVVAGNLPVLPESAKAGLKWATRRFLRAGVVLLGVQLSVAQVLQLGGGMLLVVLVTVVVTFFGTVLLGRLLGLPRGLTLMVSTGFSICGASAVAAVEGIVEREESEVATAIGLVTLFGSISMLVLPLLANGVELGAWAGASVHEVAQVVAAASPAGAAAVAAAVVVKLSRVVLLAPLAAGLSIVERRRRPAVEGKRPPLIPLFVLGFLAMVALRSTSVFPEAWVPTTKDITGLLLAGALFGLGTGVQLRSLAGTGPKALVLGLGSTVLVTVVAYTGVLLAQ